MREKKKFVISTFPEGMHGSFIRGPFNTIKETTEEYGTKGTIIFALQINRVAKPIRWWKDKTYTWEKF